MKAKFISNLNGDLEIKNPYDDPISFKLLFDYFPMFSVIKIRRWNTCPIQEIDYSEKSVARYVYNELDFRITRSQI